jgi:hypothetical protein
MHATFQPVAKSRILPSRKGQDLRSWLQTHQVQKPSLRDAQMPCMFAYLHQLPTIKAVSTSQHMHKPQARISCQLQKNIATHQRNQPHRAVNCRQAQCARSHSPAEVRPRSPRADQAASMGHLRAQKRSRSVTVLQDTCLLPHKMFQVGVTQARR